jgi:hypothetical protein
MNTNPVYADHVYLMILGLVVITGGVVNKWWPVVLIGSATVVLAIRWIVKEFKS